jgi:hypothetical protein
VRSGRQRRTLRTPGRDSALVACVRDFWYTRPPAYTVAVVRAPLHREIDVPSVQLTGIALSRTRHGEIPCRLARYRGMRENGRPVEPPGSVQRRSTTDGAWSSMVSVFRRTVPPQAVCSECPAWVSTRDRKEPGTSQRNRNGAISGQDTPGNCLPHGSHCTTDVADLSVCVDAQTASPRVSSMTRTIRGPAMRPIRRGRYYPGQQHV